MAHLIQLRQRVKAIETIKKITHAMRLISMTTHARLKSRHEPIERYKNASCDLFRRLLQQDPSWTSSIFYPSPIMPRRRLYILLSSNKGLCGNFNTQLFKLLDKQHLSDIKEPIYYITIGNQAVDYIHGTATGTVLIERPDISLHTLQTLTTECMQAILQGAFTHVSIIGNTFKTFFKQVPQETVLIPYEKSHQEASSVEYMWEQPVADILPVLAEQCLRAQIYSSLFESLLAEQAARFVSMDTATRNARTLLEETQLLYNKTRQLKITKELTELMSGL